MDNLHPVSQALLLQRLHDLYDSPAASRECNFRLMRRAIALHLNETVDDRVFPYGVPGAGTLPGLHRIGISPGPTRNPNKEFLHQLSHRLRHNKLMILPIDALMSIVG